MKSFFKKLIHVLYSLHVQVLLVFIAIGLIPLYVFSNIVTDSYNKKIITQRSDELKSYGTVISNLIISTDYLTNQISSDVDTEISEVAEIYQGRIMIVDDNLKVIKDTYDIETGKVVISTEVIKCFSSTETIYSNEVGNYIQLTMPIVDSTSQTVSGVLIMSFSEKNLHLISESVSANIRIILLILTIFVIMLAAIYSLIVTNPLKVITKSINGISQGNMDSKVDMHGYTEVISLSNSFNAMIDVIQSQEQSRQEFVSNVSHELKTPLASIKVLADSLITQQGIPEDTYQEFLGDITDEVQRMTDIINDLLSMVKLDKSSAHMDVKNQSINELLENILKRLRPIASERKIELIYESFRPVMADVDDVKLSIAFNNLIENAIKYNYDAGWVKITLNADHKFFYITVQDSGVGIPEDVQDKVFDRFYRVDKARSRDTGGTGLGLSITRNAILLHRGSVKLYSKEKEGTTFTVRIPLNYIRQDMDE